jgi:hypothetical protein
MRKHSVSNEGLWKVSTRMVLDYKGKQVTFSNNTSSRTLFNFSKTTAFWDNCSLTKAGDVRSFHQLSALRLFSKAETRDGLQHRIVITNQKKRSLLETRD